MKTTGKTFHIQTLGCKVNQYESDGISVSLEHQGWEKKQDKTGADVYIINTCAVTSKAGTQSRQAIRKIIRENPDAKVIVTGCHAQTDPDQIRSIKHVDQVICHKDKVQIAARINDICDQAAPFDFQAPDHTRNNTFKGFDHTVKGEMTRAYLKIQDGCESFCTYCIVPYARGSSVSMPEAEVMQHLERLHAAGFKEVILTGIHTGMYGRDLNPQTTLTRLLQKLNREKPILRIRLSSIEPTEVDDGLIRLATPGNILCNHFHIPLQSGDDAVLAKMKRPYSADMFEKVIQTVHERVPNVGIGLDVMVGFPSETDDQFENTYRLIDRLPVSYLHVFPFSARKGTPAYHFTPKVDSKVIKARTLKLRELDRIKRKRFIDSNKNKPLQGLIQHRADDKTGMLKAVTSNYLTVFLNYKQGLLGKTIDLEIKHCHKDLRLEGDIVSLPTELEANS